MPTFVLNDENQVNSYGFRILNSGISLDRFKANPVMLDDHYNSTRAVLGRWANVRLDGALLKADDEFDIEDLDTEKIAGKVKRGFINGASMGVTFNRDYMKQQPDGTYLLEKCELYEASIVAIPSNANGLRLFAETGELLSESEIKLSLSDLPLQNTKKDENIIPKNMEKIILTAAAIVALAGIGVTNAENGEAVSKGIEGLQAKLSAAESALLAANALKADLQNKLDAQKTVQIDAMLNEAKLAGKILAADEQQWREDAIANYDLTARSLARIPAKTNLSGQVITPENPTGEVQIKNIDEFEKLSLSAQLVFKKENPAAYAKLFA